MEMVLAIDEDRKSLNIMLGNVYKKSIVPTKFPILVDG